MLVTNECCTLDICNNKILQAGFTHIRAGSLKNCDVLKQPRLKYYNPPPPFLQCRLVNVKC